MNLTAANEEFTPQYRFSLRARIAQAGFRTVAGLAREVGVDPSQVSRILSGYQLPSLRLGQAMASALGITLRQLKELL